MEDIEASVEVKWWAAGLALILAPVAMWLLVSADALSPNLRVGVAFGIFAIASIVGAFDLAIHRESASWWALASAGLGLLGALFTGTKDIEKVITDSDAWRFAGWAGLGAVFLVLFNLAVVIFIGAQARRRQQRRPAKS